MRIPFGWLNIQIKLASSIMFTAFPSSSRFSLYNNMGTSLLHFLLLLILLTRAHSLMFCFTKHSPKANKTNRLTQQTQEGPQSQLRSYHPHYINSISYPQPVTPHIYYGEVVSNKPVFHFKNIHLWDPSSIEKLTINGVQYTDASAKYYLLRREQEFRYMLVLQIQNSLEHEVYYSIDFFRRKDHFLAICQYQDSFKAYVIYLTKHDRILKLGAQKGLNLNVRNESSGSARSNWKFSQALNWKGRNNILNMNGSNYVGVVIELEYFDRNLKNDVHINLHQLANPTNLTLEDFSSKEEEVSLETLLPPKMKKSRKYENCSAAAAEKIFDGLSYQYGTLKIKNGSQAIQNAPKELLSFCPSRKRFPWGFLWDDGFHCEVAVRQDQLLSLRVIKSWLDTMLDNGWIPRQQNRGEQRQYLCSCPRFMQKDIKDGNPPTLILALEYLRRQKKLNPSTFPKAYWQKIKKWYQWFLNTQKDGDVFLFRWHDSIHQMGASFTSGMDDFPRPDYSRGHVDLQAWMYFFTKFMAETAHIYGDSSHDYISNLQLIRTNFHFFVEIGTHLYKDIANNTSHSPHFGYPNILPIAFGISAYGSPQYNATMSAIKAQLDLGVGLASISKLSSHYLQDENAYWKGPVWININYLFLRGLKLYYPEEKAYYNKLRADLLKTVCSNWQKSGYFYENYINGTGSFSFPFNGWTSLIAVIIEENY